MDRLGDQIADLAWNLVSDSERRRQFVVENRLATQRLREQFARDRQQVQRELQHQAQEVVSTLRTSTESIKRDVARTMTNLHHRRTRAAVEQSTTRRQFVSRVRRSVSSNLSRQRTRRQWAARQQAMEVSHSLQRIRRRVRELRCESVNMTSAMAAQMQAGRRALVAARERMSTPVSASVMPRRFIGAMSL